MLVYRFIMQRHIIVLTDWLTEDCKYANTQCSSVALTE